MSGSHSVVPEEFEQRYPPPSHEPVQVWIFCRLCRCRMQVRTIPEPRLPFRCYCGYGANLAKFDVFADEDEARRFVGTFEEIYQTTKKLLQEAEMPMPTTRMYKADEVRRIKAGQSGTDDSTEEEPEQEKGEDDKAFRAATRQFTDAVVKAKDVLERHEALAKLGSYAFARRAHFPDAKRVCHQACETDVQMAHEVVKEATRRWKRGEAVKLKFPTFKRLILLYVEERQLDRALEVAVKGAQLGLPGYDERVQMLRNQIAKQQGR